MRGGKGGVSSEWERQGRYRGVPLASCLLRHTIEETARVQGD